MPTLGPVELVVILVIVTMLFGVGKLPEVFGAVGKGIKEFRRNSTIDTEKAVQEPETPSEPAQASETTEEPKSPENPQST
jgi:sec-independent protein translocase protein TatA